MVQNSVENYTLFLALSRNRNRKPFIFPKTNGKKQNKVLLITRKQHTAL